MGRTSCSWAWLNISANTTTLNTSESELLGGEAPAKLMLSTAGPRDQLQQLCLPVQRLIRLSSCLILCCRPLRQFPPGNRHHHRQQQQQQQHMASPPQPGYQSRCQSWQDKARQDKTQRVLAMHDATYLWCWQCCTRFLDAKPRCTSEAASRYSGSN